VIADGGIRTTGDVAKAVAFGADMVMVGGMFAGHEESPGTLEEVDGKLYKLFYGSASAVQKGNNKNVEGRSMLVDFRGPIADTLQTMKENLQSAVSYVGGTRLLDLRESEFVYLPPLK
jgi:GMP reductase